MAHPTRLPFTVAALIAATALSVACSPETSTLVDEAFGTLNTSSVQEAPPPQVQNAPPVSSGDAENVVIATSCVNGIPGRVGEDALATVCTLPVAPHQAGKYKREDQFGKAWTDDNTITDWVDGCYTRGNVLLRDLVDKGPARGGSSASGCAPTTGVLHDPYTGTDIQYVHGKDTSDAIQIDHIVPLSNAFRTGAQALSEDDRIALANDPLNLVAVDGPTNNRKGDKDVSKWLPPNGAAHCSYVAAVVAVKHAYGLWMTFDEREAIRSVLSSCPGQPLPTQDEAFVQSPVTG